jgi:hypothetical protein
MMIAYGIEDVFDLILEFSCGFDGPVGRVFSIEKFKYL